jgi:cytochrome P450
MYLPFSAGQRNCIGKNLSFLEVKIVLIKFLKQFDY